MLMSNLGIPLWRKQEVKTHDVSTGLSGLLGDSTSDTSVTSGDDDGLRIIVMFGGQSSIHLNDTLSMSRLATGLTLPERSMFQPVPTIFVYMFCRFCG